MCEEPRSWPHSQYFSFTYFYVDLLPSLLQSCASQ
uniref:Uncharacterized protein n=1 Tax=Arundo donax TaxID=35708 RepID=A0A0A9ABR5_ARUDO